jgi:hypothetical protein
MKWPKISAFTRPGTLFLALLVVLATGWAHRIASTPSEAQRTVVVGLTERPSTPGELHGMLVEGTLPEGVRDAEVLSDRDCAPDPDGISHCLNELALGETRITIRHHRRMAEVPCLRPGETVTVMDAATYAERRS